MRIDDIRRWCGTWRCASRSKRAAEDAFAPETLAAPGAALLAGERAELANVIEHALIVRDDGPVRPEHLPQCLPELRGPLRLSSDLPPPA